MECRGLYIGKGEQQGMESARNSKLEGHGESRGTKGDTGNSVRNGIRRGIKRKCGDKAETRENGEKTFRNLIG